MERWARAHPDHRVQYVLSGSSEAAVRAFTEDNGVDTTALSVVPDPGGEIAERYGITATPTLLLFDADGELVGRYRRVDRVPSGPAELVPVLDTGRELGTSYDALVLAPRGQEQPAREALARARALCRRLEARLSEWRPDSDISVINRSAAQRVVPVSPLVRRVLTGALHTARVTGGAFDVTWYPLAELWRGAEQSGRLPARAAVAAALQHVGWQKVSLTGAGVRFRQARVRVGLGGVAKGLIVDELFAELRRAGYEHVVVNIGGDLRTSGRDEHGEARRVAVRDPYDPQRIVAHLAAADIAIATSGNYLRGFVVAGQRFGHIVDPRTGEPASFDGSVTVLTRDAAMADALATGLFVMGPDDGLALVERTPGVEAVFATRGGLRYSRGAPVSAALPRLRVGRLRLRQPVAVAAQGGH